MVEVYLYRHPLEEIYLKEIKENGIFSEEIIDYYKNYEEKFIQPDLLGKTLKVGEKQFFNIYIICKNIANILELELPNIYIYEDFYYGVESKGITKPWIEISSKTIEDFSEKELKFLIAKQLCSIKLGHTYNQILIDETLEAYNKGKIIPGADTMIKSMKIIMSRYSRAAHYTSDCFAYIVTKDLKTSIDAILKCVLNSCFLAENLNISEFIKQGKYINELSDNVYEYTKLDERIPYAPFRIKNLIKYASSKNGIKAI